MFVQGILNYLAFMGTSLAMLAAAMILYLQITPYDEIRLMRAGNRAAAFGFGGAVVGMAITLYGVGTSTWRVVELAAWGIVGLLSQIAVFFAVSALIGRFREGIEEDRAGYGTALGSVSIAIGILNAAALGS